MKRLLGRPITNAACISVFTIFYAAVFIVTAGNADFISLLYSGDNRSAASLWDGWSEFLAAGNQRYIAAAIIAVTALVVILLLSRRRPYDEYHISILTHCLAVAVVLTMIAIAVFYVLILNDPSRFVEKFTFFITVHWATVVLADLAYVLICRWR